MPRRLIEILLRIAGQKPLHFYLHIKKKAGLTQQAITAASIL